MSDYFLNRIYDSLLNKKPAPKKPKNLNEKKEISAPATLQQAYYRIRVEQINEATDILMQQEPSGDVEEFKVSDDLAKKIKKDIKKEVGVETETGKTTIDQLFDSILDSKGWKKGNPEYNSVFQQTIQAFDLGDIVSANISKYGKLVAEKNNPTEQSLLTSPYTVFSLQNLIPSWFNEFFEDKNGLPTATALWDIRFKQKVAVGKLELLLTLLSSGRKGDVGDVLFNSFGEVEVKGTNARMGGDGFAHNYTAEELDKILSRGTGGQLSVRTAQRIKAGIDKRIDAIIVARSKMTRPKPEEIELLQKTKQAIDQSDNLAEIVNTVDASTLPSDAKSAIKNMIKELTKQKEGLVKGSFAPAVTTFFSLYKELSDEQLVDGLVATRNYKVIGSIPALKAALNYIVSQKKATLFSESGMTDSLKRLIGALHIVVYQQVQKFNNILFANDEARKVILYTFKDTDLTAAIVNMYNFLEKNNAVVNLGVDKMFSSAGITFNI
jgi:hypothetical protein